MPITHNYSEPVKEQGLNSNLDISRYLIPSVVAIEGNNETIIREKVLYI